MNERVLDLEHEIAVIDENIEMLNNSIEDSEEQIRLLLKRKQELIEELKGYR